MLHSMSHPEGAIAASTLSVPTNCVSMRIVSYLKTAFSNLQLLQLIAARQERPGMTDTPVTAG